MTETVVVAAGIALAAALYIWTIYLPKRRGPTPAQQQWIVTTLESIRAEADRKRLHLHAEPKFDVDTAFDELRRLLTDYPGTLQERVEDMATRWQELNSKVVEFKGQETGTTLQNSLIATRTSHLANEIGSLADEIRADLDKH